MIKALKANFFAGLAVLLPIFLTVILLWNLFLMVDGILSESIRLMLGNVVKLEFFQRHHIPGLGFVAVVIMIFVAGAIARNFIGKRVITITERVMGRIPLANKIYGAINQIAKAILSDKREVFQKPVLVEYPKKNMYSIGFFTQDTQGPVQESLPEDVISIFLPTTPNPTSGFLLFVPKSDVIALDLSVEEALKLVISGGAIIPTSLPQIPHSPASLPESESTPPANATGTGIP
jgi:uncharacterized membrane protein